MNTKVKLQVKRAYNEDTRQLTFKASAAVSINDAVKIMTEALDIDSETVRGYNEFYPAVLRKLPKGSKVTLAREYSVAVYVTLPEGATLQDCTALGADECGQGENGIVRLWWD